MATINPLSHNAVLSMSPIVPNMLSTASWPSVPPKTPSEESDKVPQDYYPSLDEIQHSERKVRQQNTSHSNHALNLSLGFEKPLSPTLTKMKNSDGKKAEAQEEAINKNIQMFKYVQDIEKMHESLTQQEQKHSASNNHGVNPGEATPTNSAMPKLSNSTVTNYSSVDVDSNANCSIGSKDSATSHTRVVNPRSRRSYVHNPNVQAQGSYEEQHTKKIVFSYHDEIVKKSHSTDSPQSENKTNSTTAPHDGADAQKPKISAKSTQELQSVETDVNNKIVANNNEPRLPAVRMVKEYQNIATKLDVAKTAAACQSRGDSKQDNRDQREDVEAKKTKLQSTATASDKDQQSQKPPPEMLQKNSIPRPAVILLDETSDVAKNSSLPTELTFGFEINEQLLLSEDSGNEESPATSSPSFSAAVPPPLPPLVKPSPSFERNNPPVAFEKPNVRYDKFSSNYHMQQSPNAHVTPPPPPVHPVMMQALPYMSYPARFPPPTYLPPPPPPPPEIVEKFHQPKEDFSMLYVAPEEELNVQTYNHDKIVSFVGLGKIVSLPRYLSINRVTLYT